MEKTKKESKFDKAVNELKEKISALSEQIQAGKENHIEPEKLTLLEQRHIALEEKLDSLIASSKAEKDKEKESKPFNLSDFLFNP